MISQERDRRKESIYEYFPIEGVTYVAAAAAAVRWSKNE